MKNSKKMKDGLTNIVGANSFIKQALVICEFLQQYRG